VSTRSYLSIGDVLTLLRQEFPDVTISKIRFLESQGLVNPERTPSGYRKFYEHDVERLRWVLRQQREHFLPLKVIKDRLDEDANGSEPRTESARGPKRTAASVATAVPDTSTMSAAASDAPVGAAAAAVADTPSRPSAGVPASRGGMPPGAPAAAAAPVLGGQGASSTRRSAGSGSVSSESGERGQGVEPASGRPGVPTAAVATPPVARAHRANLAAPPHRAADAATNGSGNGTATDTVPGGPAPTADGPTPRRTRGAGSATGPAAGSAGVSTPPPGSASDAAPAPAPDLTLAPRPDADRDATGPLGSRGGASLTLDELCSASGLSAATVAQLQEYGLVRAAVIGGAEYFDEEALTVANVAAKFAAFGIEARHLRLYKNAADREAGFIEQVVIPMVRQRNPEARARAGRTAEDLAGLGRQLKGSLLRTALGDLLNG